MASLLTDVFYRVLSVSAMATVLVLLIFLVRWLLKNQLKPRWTYWLWMLLAVRLLLPWTPESSFSVFNLIPLETNETSTASHRAALENEPAAESKPASEAATPTQPTEPIAQPPWSGLTGSMPETKSFLWMPFVSVVWLIGAVTMLGYILAVNMRFSMKIKKEPPVADPKVKSVFEQCIQEMKVKRQVALIESNQASTPMLAGIVRPKLLMPGYALNTLNDSQLRYVFLHELSHVKRNDIAANWLMNVLLALHWFNPLLWYAYRKMREDQEIACDSLALTRIGPDESRDYAAAIIKLLEAFANQVRLAGVASISGNKKELKRRIIMITLLKNNSYKMSLLGLAVILIISGCALTNAKSTGNAGAGTENAQNEAPAQTDIPVQDEDEVQESNPSSDFAIRANGKLISLKDFDNQIRLAEILGEPISENTETLGDGADTHTGSQIKTLTYDGLQLTLFSADQDQYWVMKMDVAGGEYATAKGVQIGDTVEEIQKLYPDIEIAKDGRTDPNNCAYEIRNDEESNYLSFEVKDGIVEHISVYHLIP